MSEKKLSEYSKRELHALFKSYEKRKLEETTLKPARDIVIETKKQKINDVWSLYDYGGGFFKAVYVKNRSTPKKAVTGVTATDSDIETRLSQSVSRAKARIFELAMCNEFEFFCTFTLDEKKHDRFDLKSFRKDFAQFIRNINRNRDDDHKILYLNIPEEHKNGAWHFHGLIKGLSTELPFEDLKAFTLKDKIPYRLRNTIKSGKTVYNWEKYAKKFGYFTCTRIESREACARYCTKYITKSLAETSREKGDHLYFASQGLKGRETLVKYSADECPFVDWDFENRYIKVKEITVPKTGL